MKLWPDWERFRPKTPRQRRILIWYGIVSGILISIYIFGLSAWFVLVKGRKIGSANDPILWKIPVALNDVAASPASGRKLSYLGYEFEVPWNDLDDEKTRTLKNWQLIRFHSGKGIVFYTSSANEFVNSFLDQKSSMKKRMLRWTYGADTLQSDYAFIRAALETSPGSIGLLTP